MSRELSEECKKEIQSIRTGIANARNRLGVLRRDAKNADLKDSFRDVEGSLTTCLICLHIPNLERDN